MAYQPKSYKKFVATAATATLVASAIVPVAFADNASTASFTDVGDKYKEAVDYLVNNNIALGLTETTFGVNSTIKRGDAAIMLAKALGIVEDEEAAASGFSDVPARAALAINSLKAAGIVNGKTTTRFGFEDNLTRGEVSLLMANAKAYNLSGSVSSLKFTDVIGTRYESAVAGMVEGGITSGKTTTSFGTGEAIKRGDYAIFLYKAENLVADSGISTVVAENGKVTVKFAKKPEATPVVSDFKITRSINSDAPVAVSPSLVWDEATLTATFTVPVLDKKTTAQTVTHFVSYKNSNAKSASFVIAATDNAKFVSLGTESNGSNLVVTLFFDQPLTTASLNQLNSYKLDSNVNSSSDVPLYPTSVNVVTPASADFFKAGQVVQVTYSNHTPVANNQYALAVSGLEKVGGGKAEDFTEKFYPSTSLDNSAPTFALEYLSPKVINAGTNVEVSALANGTTSNVVAGQWRILKPDGTRTAYASFKVEDGAFDENSERLLGTISTAGWLPGLYTLEYSVLEANGNVLSSSVAAGDQIRVTASDISAPVVSNAVSSYNSTSNKVTVEGQVADATLVNSVQYSVYSYDLTSNTYTEVQGWTNGSAADGSFNEDVENFTFTTQTLAPGKQYVVAYKTTDSLNNVSGEYYASLTAGGEITTPYAGTGKKASVFAIASDATAPTLTAAITTNGNTKDVDTSAAVQIISKSQSINVTGTATDTANAPAIAQVSDVQYQVLRDSDNNGSYETVVQAYTNSGVTATDGSFNTASEAYGFTYVSPTQSGNYKIVVKSIDTAGNESATQSLDFELDLVVPTASIAISPTDAEDGVANNDLLVTFSEAVTGFDAADVLVYDRNDVILTGNGASQFAPATGVRNAYTVKLTTGLSAGQKVRVFNTTDLVGNVMTDAWFTK